MHRSICNWTETDYINRADWIIPITVDILLIIAVIWIIFSLVHYGIKNNKWHSVKRNNFEKLSSGWIYSSVLLCAGLCLARFVIGLIGLVDVKGYNENIGLCKTISYLRSCLYTFIHPSVWFFLWLRQYTLYTNRMLTLTYSKPLRYLSFIIIVLIVISGFGLTTFTVFIYDFEISEDGCTSIIHTQLSMSFWIFVVTTIILVHGILFALFSHALLKSRNIDKKNNSKNLNPDFKADTPSKSNRDASKNKRVQTNSPKTHKRESKRVQSRKSVKLILKKTFLLVLASIVVEITLPLLWNFVKMNRRIVIASYNVAAFLNLLLIIFSFANSRKMLFSFFFRMK